MSTTIEFLLNQASEIEIATHLRACDADFVPPLSDRVQISDYARKLSAGAVRFEAWCGRDLVGLVAAYCNDLEGYSGHISSVSVMSNLTGRGIAGKLMGHCIKHMKATGMREVNLQVSFANRPAISLYENLGFIAGKENLPFVTMTLHLDSWD